MLPFDLHVLSMQPAFNLSQDQTLQFNHISCLWQQIFLTKNPNLKLLRFDASSIFASKNTTEHPHKLSDQIVKERFASSAKRPAFYRPEKLCQLILEKIFNKVLQAICAHLSRPMTPGSGWCRQEDKD